ncbi:alpha-1,2-mannosyltransferase [Amycolatopsis marina]|uniref:Alpha-1,2-mannosyltransferase n=1 Tax=Amycolatopsis marina TaxID=490629 RepID=A0A1I0VG14_9PSEU|nr:glycosyltransferase 87 family protein [Amycolatopsis marina]SFA75304.1 alpha-1,2-mannosyltransferase [Amycolatopsis marina]
MLQRHGVRAADAAEMRRHTTHSRWLLVVLGMTALAFILIWPGFLDLHVYRAGGYAWLHGIGLYSDQFPGLVPGMPLPFTYPPFAAIVFAPVWLLPWHVAKVLITTISVLGLLAATLTVSGRLYGRRTVSVVVGVGAAAAWALFEPARQTISFGQINLILMGLVALDCLLPRTRWPRGLLIGLASAIKLTPAVFVLYFLARKQYRAAAVSFGSFVGFGLFAWALAPSDTARYWFDSLLDPERIGGLAYAFNQNIRAVLYRLLPEGTLQTGLWMALVAVALVLAWMAARRALAAGDQVNALLAIALFGLLASPVSWSHHWVWIIPAAIVLVRWAQRSGIGVRIVAGLVLVVFAIGPHSHLPQTHDLELQWTWWQHLLGSSYVIIGVVALLLLALRRPSDQH